MGKMKQVEMKTAKKEKLRLFESVATLIIVATVLTFSILVNSGVFAWFAQSTEVEATGISISAHNDETIESIRYYRVTNTIIETTDGVKHNKYHFAYNESVLKNQFIYGTTTQERNSFDTPIGMSPYSELSGDCQILIEVTLSTQAAITLSVETEENSDFLGNIISDKLANGVYDLVPEKLPLSSVVRYAVFNTLPVENQAFIVEEDVVSEQGVSFIEFDGTNYNFVPPANKSITLGENRNFFIYFDYNRALVEYVNDRTIEYVEKAEVATNGSYDAITLGSTNLLFSPDFNFIVTTEGE